MSEWTSATRQHVATIKAKLQVKKWVIQPVSSGGSGQSFNYAYTIGLRENGGACEVLVASLPYTLAEYILDGIAEYMLAANGTPPSEWDVNIDYETYHTLKPVWITRPSNEMPMHMATAYYGTRQVSTVQYVWPTGTGVYPWDEQWPGHLVQPVGGMGRPM